MFWDKKDKNKLPDLPSSPSTLPIRMPGNENEDEESHEIHKLPSFPDSPMNKGFSQSAIKDAVNTEEQEEVEDNSQGLGNFKIVEMEEWSPEPVKSSKMQTFPVVPSPPLTSKSMSSISKQKEIYIKIDKFNSARRSIEFIGEKINQIDNLLKRVREVKLREEQELTGWEKELAVLRSRIKEINSTIFE